MGKVTCEGVTKKCGASYGIHKFSIELRGRGQGEKYLCSTCRSTLEAAEYTLTQLADIPAVRDVKTVTSHGASSPAAWQSWIDRD